MSYNVLEKNGVLNENVDGAAFNHFSAANKSGIIRGVLNECAVTSPDGLRIVVSSGELLIHGFRVKITEAKEFTFPSLPSSTISYHIVAKIVLSSDRSVSFDLLPRVLSTLVQQDLFKAERGTYEVEVARFDHTMLGVSNLRKTLNTITSDGIAGNSVFIKYSAYSDGSYFTDSPTSESRYIGFASALKEPTEKGAYKWSNIKPSIVSDLGSSEALAMSQKGVNDAISFIQNGEETLNLSWTNTMIDSSGNESASTNSQVSSFINVNRLGDILLTNSSKQVILFICEYDVNGSFLERHSIDVSTPNRVECEKIRVVAYSENVSSQGSYVSVKFRTHGISQAVEVANVVTEYAFPQVIDSSVFEKGGITLSNGLLFDSDNRVRSKITFYEDTCISASDGVIFYIVFYTYDGNEKGSVSWVYSSDKYQGTVLIKKEDFAQNSNMFRIVAKKEDDSSFSSFEDVIEIRTVKAIEHCVWEKGTITNGLDDDRAGRIRSGNILFKDLLLYPKEGFQISINGYTEDNEWKGVVSSANKSPIFIKDVVPSDVSYIRLVVSRYLTGGWTVDESSVPYFQDLVKVYTASSPEYVSATKSLNTEALQKANEAVDVANGAEETANEAKEKADSSLQSSDLQSYIAGLFEPVEDVPIGGVKNAILNFDQLINIKWYAQKKIPQVYGALYKGDHTGMPYSSTRQEGLFVPNNVSFHTFLTALENPNSYLYNVDLGEEPYGNTNGDTYYGTVCSIAAAHALNIEPNYSTHQWQFIPGMHAIPEQSINALKLGDTIVNKDMAGGHVVMVTGIRRNAFGVTHVTISEACNNFCQKTEYTAEQLITGIYQDNALIKQGYPTSEYIYCRYDSIDDVEYVRSEYVSVGDEAAKEYSFDLPIMPRKGDQSVWVIGRETYIWNSASTSYSTEKGVILDILNAGEYTSIDVYKDGVAFGTYTIDSSAINLGDLEAGAYSARLTNGTEHSNPCSWIVVNLSLDSVAVNTYEGQKKVDISFSHSDNAEPKYFIWARGDENAKGYLNKGTVYVTPLTDAEKISEQYRISYGGKSYKDALLVRVAFKTEFGMAFSDFSDVISVK